MGPATPAQLGAIVALVAELTRNDPWPARPDHERTTEAVLSAATAYDIDLDVLWGDLADHPNPDAAAIAAVAGPPERLDRLIGRRHPTILSAAARHPATTGGQLARILALSHDDDRLLHALTCHPHCPAATLATISRRAGANITTNDLTARRRAHATLSRIEDHPNCTAELARALGVERAKRLYPARSE